MEFCFLVGLAKLLILPQELSAAEPGKSPIPIPSGPEIMAKLRAGHPRLLASREDFAQLKQQIATNEHLKTWELRLREQADEIMRASPSRYELPDGVRLLATSRSVMNRVYTLGLMYQLEGEKKYADRAWQELSTASEFKDWNPHHFLDTAEMTHAFAIGYDWMYDVWTEAQRATLRRAIVEKGFRPALSLFRGHEGFSRRRNNWNQVCNGGIGMGALALGDVEPELSGEILAEGLQSIQIGMAEFAPDGASVEGPGYWNYATVYNSIFLAGLDGALGTDFGLSKMPAFSETGLFPIYLTGPLGRTFNYADGGDHSIHAAQMFWLSRKFHRPLYAWYAKQSSVPWALDLLWFNPASGSPKEEHLPLDKYFRRPEVVTMRSDWESPQACFVGFKAGDNSVSHSHLDLGSFVFDALGVRWAMDLGGDNYNLPAYFGGKRWTYYRLRAEGQNTLVINPSDEPDQDPEAAAKMIRFKSESENPFAIADLTPAYGKTAKRVWRGMSLPERKQLLIQDEIEADKPAEVWWFMHTPAAIKIDEDKRSATLQQVKQQLEAVILSPENAHFEIMDAQPMANSPHPDRQAKNEGVKKLAIHLSEVKSVRLVVLLMPGAAGQGQSREYKITALSGW